MIRQGTEIFGGPEVLTKRIAEAIRKRDPEHPIAVAEDSVKAIAGITRSELLGLLWELEISLDEAMGPLELTAEERKHYEAEAQGRACVVDVVTLGEVQQALYVGAAIEQGSSGFGEVNL